MVDWLEAWVEGRTDVPDEVYDALFMRHYRQMYGLSVPQYDAEPWNALMLERIIWDLETKRDNLRSRSGTT